MLNVFRRFVARVETSTVSEANLPEIDNIKQNLLLEIQRSEKELQDYRDLQQTNDKQYQSLKGQAVSLEKLIQDLKDGAAKKRLQIKLEELQRELTQLNHESRQNIELEIQDLEKQKQELTAAITTFPADGEQNLLEILKGTLVEVDNELQTVMRKRISDKEIQLLNVLELNKRAFVKYVSDKYIEDLSNEMASKLVEINVSKVRENVDYITNQNLDDQFEGIENERQLLTQQMVEMMTAVVSKARLEFITNIEELKVSVLEQFNPHIDEDEIKRIIALKVEAIKSKIFAEVNQEDVKVFKELLKQYNIKLARKNIEKSIKDCDTSLEANAKYFVDPKYKEFLNDSKTILNLNNIKEYYLRLRSVYEKILLLNLEEYEQIKQRVANVEQSLKTLFLNGKYTYIHFKDLKDQILVEQSSLNTGKLESLEIESEICSVSILCAEAQIEHVLHDLVQRYGVVEQVTNTSSGLLNYVPYAVQLRDTANAIIEYMAVTINPTEQNGQLQKPAELSDATSSKLVDMLRLQLGYNEYLSSLQNYLDLQREIDAKDSTSSEQISMMILYSLNIYLNFAKLPIITKNTDDYKIQLASFEGLIAQYEDFHVENYESSGNPDAPFNANIILLVNIKNTLSRLPQPPVLKDFIGSLEEIISSLAAQTLDDDLVSVLSGDPPTSPHPTPPLPPRSVTPVQLPESTSLLLLSTTPAPELTISPTLPENIRDMPQLNLG